MPSEGGFWKVRFKTMPQRGIVTVEVHISYTGVASRAHFFVHVTGTCKKPCLGARTQTGFRLNRRGPVSTDGGPSCQTGPRLLQGGYVIVDGGPSDVTHPRLHEK